MKGAMSSPSVRMMLRISVVAIPKFLKLVVVLVIDAMMARHLGVASFGLFSLVFAVFTALVTVARFGLENLLVRDSINGLLDNERLAQVLSVRLLGALIAQLVFIGTAVWVPMLKPFFYYLLFLSFGFIALAFAIFEPLMQARERFGLMALAQSGVILVGAIVKLYLIYSGAGLKLFWMAILAEAAVAAIITTVFMIATNGLPRVSENFRVFRGMVGAYAREGFPFMLAGLSVIAFMRVDQIMLAALAGTESVGLFSAALRITESFFSLATIASVVLFPRLLKQRLTSREEYEAGLVMLLRVFLAVGLCISILMTGVSGPLVALIFGEDYAGSAPLVALHAWVMVPAFWGVVSHRWLVAEQLGRYEFMRTTLGLGVNVMLNIILIPQYGAIGACVATLVSQLFSYVLVNYFVANLRKLGELQVRAIGFGP